MKGTWIAECNNIARRVKIMRGMLIGVGVDDDAKADAFVKYWAEKHPHVEIVNRSKDIGIGFVIIQVRLNMEAANGNPTT